MKSLRSRLLSRSALCAMIAAPALVTGLTTLHDASTSVNETAIEAGLETPPAMFDLATAQETTTVLTNALVAAVASISDTTPPGATLMEIEAGSKAVSALVPGHGWNYRLIDATGSPLDHKNQPFGNFEVQSLAQLVLGSPTIQEVRFGKLRTLVPLTNDMHPNCKTCHVNYDALPAGTVVGAASIRVKL